MRIVLDTNIYIAAALSDSGFSEDIIKQASKAHLEVVTSEEILSEIQNKLADKFHWLPEDIDRFTTRIKKLTKLVSITERLSVVTRDPKDNKILECAVAGNVSIIVSLDQDLIKFKEFRGIAIMHPKTFAWTFPQYFESKIQH